MISKEGIPCPDQQKVTAHGRLASYPGSLIMWGQKREAGDYCFVHVSNIYVKFPEYVA